MELIALSSPDLAELRLAWCRNLTTDGVRAVLRAAPKLEVLDVQHCRNVLPQLLQGDRRYRQNVEVKMSREEESLRGSEGGDSTVEGGGGGGGEPQQSL